MQTIIPCSALSVQPATCLYTQRRWVVKCFCPLDAQVIEVWVSLLKAVPTARLVVKNKPFACPAAREHVLQLFVKKGIAGHRIDLLPLAAANAGGGHLHTSSADHRDGKQSV